MRKILVALFAGICFTLLADPESNESETKASETEAYLGVFLHKFHNPVLRKQLQIPDGTGLLVAAVAKDSPAAKAGIEKFDILLSLDEQILRSVDQVRARIAEKKVGDTVAIRLIRNGKEQAVNPVLGSQPVALNKTGEHPAQRIVRPGKKRRHRRDDRPKKNHRVRMEFDMDAMMEIYNDSNLTQQEKDKKFSDLLSKNVLKGLTLEIHNIDRRKRPDTLKSEIEKILSPLPEAIQKRMRETIYDKHGKVKPHVRIIDTKDGPAIIVEESDKKVEPKESGE